MELLVKYIAIIKRNDCDLQVFYLFVLKNHSEKLQVHSLNTHPLDICLIF